MEINLDWIDHVSVKENMLRFPKIYLCLSAVECLENKHLYFASRLNDAMKVSMSILLDTYRYI